MSEEDYAEGSECPGAFCDGRLVVVPPANCSCHINGPCGECENPALVCSGCGWEPAIHPPSWPCRYDHPMWGFQKPAPLDNTKIDYRKESHSNSSMKVVGVYPDGTSKSQVEALVKGTFGGRFDQFEDGHFTYIAYTD